MISEGYHWLAKNGKLPLYLDSGGARWYPDTDDNRRFFGEAEETYCLLPPDVYEAMDFPRVEGFDRFPWFRTVEIALEAAALAVAKTGKI